MSEPKRLSNGQFPKGNPGYGPAKGTGWGGPAKGAGAVFASGDETKRLLGGAAGLAMIADQKERDAVAMRDVLRSIAMNAAENSSARVSAANSLLDRIEGKPIQATVNHDGGKSSLRDLTDRESASDRVKRLRAARANDEPAA